MSEPIQQAVIEAFVYVSAADGDFAAPELERFVGWGREQGLFGDTAPAELAARFGDVAQRFRDDFEAAEAQILRDLSNAYPNITAIRVRDAIDRVTEVLGSIAAATAYGAAATLLTGFLVLIGAAAAGQQNRTYEAAILKTLGATRRRILLSFTLRGALLGAAAGAVAIAAGILGGWAVSTFVLESNFIVIWSNALAIVIGGIVATLLAGLAFASGPLKAKPAGILRTAD